MSVKVTDPARDRLWTPEEVSTYLGGGRVQRAQVAAELQEPGPGLARLDVPEQLVLAQLIGSEQVPDPGGAGVGRAHPGPRRPAGFLALTADRGPVPSQALSLIHISEPTRRS